MYVTSVSQKFEPHHTIVYLPIKISYHIRIDDLIYCSPWKSFHNLIESPVNYNCHYKVINLATVKLNDSRKPYGLS